MGPCPGRALEGEGWVWLPRRAREEFTEESPSVPHLSTAALGVGISINNSPLAVVVRKSPISAQGLEPALLEFKGGVQDHGGGLFPEFFEVMPPI